MGRDRKCFDNKFVDRASTIPKMRHLFAGIAQLVERDLAKVEVTGSSPVTRSKLKRSFGASFFIPLSTHPGDQPMPASSLCVP